MKKLKALKSLSAALIASITAASSISFGNYCAAIRGNGELMPAHWGALSSIVEEKGLPSAMAGGSSATITMFLLESISLNPIIRNDSERALLIKSFQGYLEALSQTPEGKAIQSILGDKDAFKAVLAKSNKLDEILNNPENKALVMKHLNDLKVLLASEEIKALGNPEFIHYVNQTIQLAKMNDPTKEPVVLYRIEQIKQALENFGKFNAETDQTLFFRPGLISFQGLANFFGQMADFYAGYYNDATAGTKVNQRLREFLEFCTPGSKTLTWAELAQARPLCRQLLGSAVLMNRESRVTGKSRALEAVGSHIPVFVTTSILTGSAVHKFKKLYTEYQSNQDPHFGSYTISNDELRFGYWGQSSDLAQVEKQFSNSTEYLKDAKSSKFLSLGEASWQLALAVSPAEPGLSRIISLPGDLLSAGGWSDLHPVMVLKAHGCDDIIYVTRKGEESKFAQGIFKRLINADEATWSRFYDMNNPNSSIVTSQKNASQIKCTDWNRFDVRKDLNELVAESMRAPLLPPPYCQ